tara:strand:+ start:75 stop:476 length:402 start_codon:yes stop_codon:yes gene_type:complete
MLTINPIENNHIDHLRDLKWQKRVLVVNTGDRIEIEKLTAVYYKDLNDRDFVVIQLDGHEAYCDEKKMSRRFTKSLLKKIKNFDESDYFILLGKDGGVKNSFTKGTEMRIIFNQVDSMPMRINEMRKKINRNK